MKIIHVEYAEDQVLEFEQIKRLIEKAQRHPKAGVYEINLGGEPRDDAEGMPWIDESKPGYAVVLAHKGLPVKRVMKAYMRTLGFTDEFFNAQPTEATQ